MGVYTSHPSYTGEVVEDDLGLRLTTGKNSRPYLKNKYSKKKKKKRIGGITH
jgi:hypothetical protein